MKGDFTIPRKTLWRMWLDGRLRFESEVLPLEMLSLHRIDPDCFAPNGDPRAADRWADDGGRA